MLLDAGDLFGPAQSVSSLDAMLKSEFLLKGMNLIGYDAVTLGETDFRYGETFLASQLEASKLDVTSANLVTKADKKPYAARYFKTTANKVTFGVIGVVGDEHVEALEEASSIDGEALTTEPMVDAIGEAQDEMGEVEVTSVLAHMSLEEARALSKKLTDVQVVVAAHERELPSGEQLDNTIVVRTGYDGKWIGHLNVEVNGQGKLTGASWNAPTLGDELKDDPDMATLYEDYLARLATEAEKIVEQIPQETPVGGSYVGDGQCQSCHFAQATQWVGTKHAHAFDTLVKSNHDYAPSCFPCHTVGFGYVGGFLLADKTPTMKHVQCESCHGAGAEHVAAPAKGWSVDPKTVCTNCHTPENSPDFDMGTYLPQVTH